MSLRVREYVAEDVSSVLSGARVNVPVPGWRSRSACRDLPSEVFVSNGMLSADEEAVAKAACARCPVRDECLAYALVHGVRYGVWGGYNEAERRPMRRLWLTQRDRAAPQSR